MYNKKSKDNLNSVHSFTSNTIPFLNSVHTNRYNKNTKKERHHLDASPPELNDKNKSYVGRFISCPLYWRYYRSYSLAKYPPFWSYPNYILIYKPVSLRKSNSLRQDRPSLLWYPARKTN